MTRTDREPSLLDYGVAVRAAVGETACGDAWVIEPDGDATLLAVIDGLGHGPYAEVAARTAARILRRHVQADLGTMLARTHEALRATRGAAVSLARIGPGGLRWLAVGNVQGVHRCARTGATTRLVTRGGTVGSRLPRLQTTDVAMDDGDVLAMFSDGVNEDAARELTACWEPAQLAARLLDAHATGDDDALMLVARYGRDES